MESKEAAASSWWCESTRCCVDKPHHPASVSSGQRECVCWLSSSETEAVVWTWSSGNKKVWGPQDEPSCETRTGDTREDDDEDVHVPAGQEKRNLLNKKWEGYTFHNITPYQCPYYSKSIINKVIKERKKEKRKNIKSIIIKEEYQKIQQTNKKD